MKLTKILIIMMFICLLLATACNGADVEGNNTSLNSSQDDLKDTSFNQAEEETQGGDYWDGGDYPGQPVYSLTLGISQVAHDAFSACGLHDNNIEHAVEMYLQENTERQMVIAQDSQQETMWSVAMTTTPLTSDVYEVSCSVIES